MRTISHRNREQPSSKECSKLFKTARASFGRLPTRHATTGNVKNSILSDRRENPITCFVLHFRVKNRPTSFIDFEVRTHQIFAREQVAGTRIKFLERYVHHCRGQFLEQCSHQSCGKMDDYIIPSRISCILRVVSCYLSVGLFDGLLVHVLYTF